MPVGWLNLSLDNKVDVGAFLTFVTLVVGMIGWLIRTILAWRNKRTVDARSGALRLLLKLLRERHGAPISIPDLKGEFEKPERKSERKAYCDRDFQFKDVPQFETAMYRLHWESKIEFDAHDRVMLRVRDGSDAFGRLMSGVLAEHSLQLLELIRSNVRDENIDEFELMRLLRLASRIDSAAAAELIRGLVIEAMGNPAKSDEIAKILASL